VDFHLRQTPERSEGSQKARAYPSHRQCGGADPVPQRSEASLLRLPPQATSICDTGSTSCRRGVGARGPRPWGMGVAMAAHETLPPPTPTEHKVLRLLDQHFTRAEAARRLGLAAEGSVDFHLRHMFREYGVNRIRKLLAIARREGWVGGGGGGGG